MNLPRTISRQHVTDEDGHDQTTKTRSGDIEREPLSTAEKEMFRKHEETITKGLSTFFVVGSALLAIRQGELYREKYGTFDAYCHERWGFGRTYAWRVIGAAERLKMLSDDDATQKPTSEFQMRPFLKLAPEAFPGVWKRVLEQAKDGKITSALIGGLLNEVGGTVRAGKAASQKRKKVSLAHGTIGEILVLLHQGKRCIETEQSEHAIATLERIERLLFGM